MGSITPKVWPKTDPYLWNYPLIHIFGIFSWHVQKVRKSQNQNLGADPAWNINSGKIESNPGGFPGFRRMRAAASSSGLRGSEILWLSGTGIFHRSDSFLLIILVDYRPPVLCAPFFTIYEAMEFAETRRKREECPDLPVRLFKVLHALWLKCEKSLELTASSHHSWCFSSNWKSRDEAALSESVLTGTRVKER